MQNVANGPFRKKKPFIYHTGNYNVNLIAEPDMVSSLHSTMPAIYKVHEF